MDKIVDPLKIIVIANGIRLPMQIDTGAAVSVISELTYNRLWSAAKRPTLQHTSVQLRTYSGEKFPVCGQFQVLVSCRGQEARLRLVVVAGKGTTLAEETGCPVAEQCWCSSLEQQSRFRRSQCGRRHLVKEELGLVKGVKASLVINKTATPCFFRAFRPSRQV